MLPPGTYRKNECNVSDEYGICPNCGHLHGDMWEYFVWGSYTADLILTCDNCETPFKVIADYHVYYISYPIEEKEKKKLLTVFENLDI